MFQKMYGSVLKIISHTHKYPAGSGMERVGVSKSLLGTYDQHWDLPVILPLTMMQNAKSWLCFRFFVFLPQRQANFLKMPLPPQMHL